ncbi:MAG: hypothetical protein JOZ49_13480, partial [Mycolicibacterium sp.]|nr:hypothetical protein [Mycolicibacterium sp.]
YSPLAFDSMLKPAAQEWASIAGAGRAGFWRYRRTRPLPASLPMTDAERRTVTAGWLLGQIIGRVQIPAPPYSEPVRIYDGDSQQWLAFPHPLLTAPSQFIAGYDWLPAVLESILLAIARSYEPPVMSSLRPYRVLRGLYDANSQDPASGIVPLSVVGLLREFMLTGSSAPGLGSRIDSVAAAQTPADRAAAAEDWLSTVRDTSAEYLAPGGAGAADGGAFATIATRLKASKTPIFRDLATDVFWATEALTGLIRDVKGILDSRTEGGATVFGTAEQVVIPKGGTF